MQNENALNTNPQNIDPVKWLATVEKADADLKPDFEKARKLYDIFEGVTQEPFNIFASNTETLMPAIFSALPRPICDSRMNAPPQISQAIEKMASYFLDSNKPGAVAFMDSMASCIYDTLVPGLGGVRYKFATNPTATILYEHVPYNMRLYPKALTWERMPWIAYKHYFTRQDLIEKFSISPEDSIILDFPDVSEKKKDCVVYEIWDRLTKTVFFLSPAYKKDFLKFPIENPLKTEYFYPEPCPLAFTKKEKFGFCPPYELYKAQAEELNRVTVRLQKVISAIQVRGAYDGSIQALSQILQEGAENALIPVENAQFLSDKGGFDNAIWFLPLAQLMQVAQQLSQARQEVKQTIYELTGISDIVRGASQASETATAQDIKNQWATLRLKKMRTQVQNYVRELIRLSINTSVHLFKPDEWQQITQITLPQDLSWEALLGGLQAPSGVQYCLDIETDSTVDLDATTGKQEAAEFMNAMGQLLGGLQPLMGLGPQGFNLGRSIILNVSKKFRLGRDLQTELQSLQMPEGPSPEMQQKEQELQKREADLKLFEATARAERDNIRLAEKNGELAVNLAEERASKQLQVQSVKAQASTNQTKGAKTVAMLEIELKTLRTEQKAFMEKVYSVLDKIPLTNPTPPAIL